MTTQRRFKQKVRARMERTGERYAAARGALTGDGASADTPEPLDDSLFETAGERIVAATGKERAEWFAILDAAGASGKPHTEIARILTGEHGVDGWWAQTLTVDFERARGLRQRHERPDGFEITKSRTLAAPLAATYAAWVDDDVRASWLDGGLEITTAVENKRVRGRWDGGPSRLVVELTAKGEARTLVQVVHSKLPDAEAAEQAKADWARRLLRLLTVVES
jgi:hypothetical protein